MKRLVVLIVLLISLSSPAQAATINLYAETAHIHTGTPTSNYYNDWDLVKRYVDASSNAGLLLFDFTGLYGEVEKATLNIFHNDVGYANPFGLFQNTSEWNPLSVTWDTRPEIGELATSFETNNLNWRYKSMDLTSLTQDWISRTVENYGLTLLRTGDISPHYPKPDTYLAGAGRPHTGPYLTIDYTPDPVPTPEPSTFLLLAIGFLGIGVAGFLRWT